jgi:hypothetical protein
MSDAILTHDAGVSAFSDAGGVVSTDDDGVSFNWDESHVVTVEAPADLQGAFDTDQFYKIEGATIARPIKQQYVVGDSVETYVKPADSLQKAAWSFDNKPFTIQHPDSGMVKNVDDIHGFWRNPRYDADGERLKEDLYIPTTDDEALAFIEEHQDVSVGFYNRVYDDFDGDVGTLVDGTDSVDGYQVQMYGDHIAGVKRGRCSAEDGCGLDGSPRGTVYANYDSTPVTDASKGEWVEWDASGGSAYGKVDNVVRDGCTTRGKGDMEVCAEDGDPAVEVEVYDDETGESKDEIVRHKESELRSWSGPSTDASTSFMSKENMTGGDINPPEWEVGDRVMWQANPEMRGDIIATDPSRKIVMVELEEDGEESGYTLTAGYTDIRKLDPSMDCACGTTDAPSGIAEMDGQWYGIAPSENSDDEPKYELDNCNDVKDAWNLRGSGDYSIEQSTLEARIKRAADAHDCPPEQKPWENTENMDDDFDIPDLSVDALADKNDSVSDLKAERDSLESTVDEMETEIREAFDAAENFTIEVDEDECVCEAVDDLVADLDEKAAEVERLSDELQEYREDERAEALDELEELGADRDEWTDESLDALEDEIERREEVLDAAKVDTSVKNAETEQSTDSDKTEKTISGTRTFGRGYGG